MNDGYIAVFAHKTQLVKAVALVHARFVSRTRFVLRQVVGYFVVTVVNAATDDRFVGIAVEKFDDYFHANPRVHLAATF